jgi:hypothetical protein
MKISGFWLKTSGNKAQKSHASGEAWRGEIVSKHETGKSGLDGWIDTKALEIAFLKGFGGHDQADCKAPEPHGFGDVECLADSRRNTGKASLDIYLDRGSF